MEFSFHGGPADALEIRTGLRESVGLLKAEEKGTEDPSLRFGMAHAFGDLRSAVTDIEMSRSRTLLNPTVFLTQAAAASALGLSEEDFIAHYRRNGRVFSLRTAANSFAPRQERYPAFQFNPNVNRDMLKQLIWLAADACPFWALFDFLSDYRQTDPTTVSDGTLNGFEILCSQNEPKNAALKHDFEVFCADYKKGQNTA